MNTLWRIEQLIKDLDDDPEAWQQVCDVIRTLRGFSAEDSANCATIEEYIQKVYLPAVEYAHITHTIETVPVYVISKSRETEPKPILLSNGPDQAKLCPVFFSYDYAEKICTGLDNGAPHPFIARIPFFALLDPNSDCWEKTKTSNLPCRTIEQKPVCCVSKKMMRFEF